MAASFDDTYRPPQPYYNPYDPPTGPRAPTPMPLPQRQDIATARSSYDEGFDTKESTYPTGGLKTAGPYVAPPSQLRHDYSGYPPSRLDQQENPPLYLPPPSDQHSAAFSYYGPGQISETKLVPDDPEFAKPKKKKGFFDYVCCGCCPCCPAWLRWLSCGCLIILLGIIIAIAVLAANFKMPTITFNGVGPSPSGLSQFQSNGTLWSLNFGLNITIVNPNIEGPTFDSIKAVAFYPPVGSSTQRVAIGGGEIHNVFIGPHSTTNITFPFSINYDPSLDKDQAILSDIASKCGLLGGAKVPLTVYYDLTLTLKILVVTISPTIPQSTKIDCPIKDGQLPQLPSGAIPSGIEGLPTATTSA